MKKSKKSEKKRHNTPGTPSGSHLFSTILILGMLLSAMVMAVSLFIYLQPMVLAYMAERNIAIPFLSQKEKELEASLSDTASGAVQSAEHGTFSQGSAESPYKAGSDPLTPESEEERELGDISDLDMEAFPTQDGVIYTAVLDTSMGPMVYYSQGDSRWADYLYGGADPMKKYGCGPSAVAMLVSSFSPEGTDITPTEMAEWAAANGYYASQSGSYHSLIPQALTAYGLKAESVQDRSPENVEALLRSGHIMVALMGRGALTENGHFVLITRVMENGYVSIADPNRYENCKKDWELSALLSELKQSYDSGGPLWAVSLGGG